MNKPQISKEEVIKILTDHNVLLKNDKMALVGIRGFYGENKIGVYDDALVWIDTHGFACFNGNTDPSKYFKRVATLKPGVWRYKKGLHGSKVYGPYPAFRQAAKVTVLRHDGKAPTISDTGNFGINIHKGGVNTTSSLGCQTIPPNQWDAFREYGYMLIKRNVVKDFPYVLIAREGK